MSEEHAKDSRYPEDLLSKYREQQHSWIVIVKQDSILKIKTMRKKEVPDTDIPSTQLISWLMAEVRERDQRDGTNQRAKLHRHQSESSSAQPIYHEQSVQVLIAGTKSKKSNRRNIVEQAQGRAVALVQSFLDGPIAAIETTDQVMDLLRETRLSDPESWRKAVHATATPERKYLQEVQDLLTTLSQQNKNVTRNAFIYNFRTGTCIYYDLGA